MNKKVYFSNIFAFLFFISSTLFAQEHSADSVTVEAATTETIVEGGDKEHSEEAEAFNPGKMMMEHIADEHEWHFATNGHTHYSIPLPCIVWNNGGLKVFSSNRFKDEHHENTASYEGLKLEEGKIVAEDGSSVFDISITKNVASLLISVVLLLAIFFTIAKSYKERAGKAPKGLQSFFEPIIVFIRDEVAKTNIGEKHYRRFLPYLLTVFFFILFNNILGLLPGSANVTGNIAVTLVLAVIAFFVTNLNGRSTYWGHIFAMPGVPKWLLVLLTPVEIIGVFMKPISLMIRLFANITAGHLILLSLIALIFIFKSLGVAAIAVPFSLFMNLIEILVAFLQAYIFTVLVSTYIGAAVEEAHH
ncbi:MAG: F0F1 ATP synthase subunit A [Arcicella sp.]|nr:F0F1 ATP synthase subunit A [Arcicella sp.]